MWNAWGVKCRRHGLRIRIHQLPFLKNGSEPLLLMRAKKTFTGSRIFETPRADRITKMKLFEKPMPQSATSALIYKSAPLFQKPMFLCTMKPLACVIATILFFANVLYAQPPDSVKMHKAPAPLFRDPIYDGAADPVVIYNRQKKEWWMFYTQRRANQLVANVGWCYGTAIGVAISKDHGQTWVYKGTPKLEFEEGLNTFWAPDVFFDGGAYHMFLAYIQGVRNDWGGVARIAHYTSPNLWN